MIASGDLKVSYLAAPAGGQVSINAVGVAFGVGDSNGGFKTVPSYDRFAKDLNTMNDRWFGSILANHFSKPVGVETMAVLPDDRLLSMASPGNISFNTVSGIVSSQILASEEVCGSNKDMTGFNPISTGTCVDVW